VAAATTVVVIIAAAVVAAVAVAVALAIAMRRLCELTTTTATYILRCCRPFLWGKCRTIKILNLRKNNAQQHQCQHKRDEASTPPSYLLRQQHKKNAD
jgi:hypothetical protein